MKGNSLFLVKSFVDILEDNGFDIREFNYTIYDSLLEFKRDRSFRFTCYLGSKEFPEILDDGDFILYLKKILSKVWSYNVIELWVTYNYRSGSEEPSSGLFVSFNIDFEEE